MSESENTLSRVRIWGSLVGKEGSVEGSCGGIKSVHLWFKART